MPEQKKIIAVVGATGAQGGGLVRAILADKDGEFAVRALTRHPDKGKALAAAGAEVVAADLDDQTSLERAFAGAYGAFCLTNFWEHFSAEKEIAQATTMARAAKARACSTSSGPPSRTPASGCRWGTTGCRRWAASTRSRTSTPRGRRTRCSPGTACRPRGC